MLAGWRMFLMSGHSSLFARVQFASVCVCVCVCVCLSVCLSVSVSVSVSVSASVDMLAHLLLFFCALLHPLRLQAGLMCVHSCRGGVAAIAGLVIVRGSSI